MKLNTSIITVTLILCCSFINGQGTWIQLDSVNGPPKASCVGFSLKGEGYIGLGRNSSGDKRSLFSYDIDQDDWDDEASLGGDFGSGLDRSSAVSFVINEKAYVGTGKATSPYLDDFWQYDPITNSWTQKASFEGSARRQAVGFGIDSLGYVGTGEDANGMTDDFWKYSPTLNQWEEIEPFPGTPRKQAIGVSMGNKGYVGTGNDGAFLKDFWEYTPSTNTWLQKPDFAGSPRNGATAFALFPKLFIATGYDNTLEYKKDVWEYNYYNGSWSQLSDFIGAPRSNATSFIIGDVAFLGTGYNGIYMDDFYAYLFPLSTNDQISEYSVQVYPNPAKDYFTITTSLKKELILNLYDLTGKHMSDHFHIDKNGATWDVRVATAPVGVYLYTLTNNEGIVEKGKVIIGD